MPQRIRAGVRRLFRLPLRHPHMIREEMDDELAFHLEARVAQFVARGMSPEAAKTEALRRLGHSLTDARTQLHRSAEHKEQRMQWHERLEEMRHDLRYAARGLMLRPGFAATAVLTLAVGIGANTAIFSTVDALLLRSLPFHEPSRLIDVVQRSPFDAANGGSSDQPWSYPKFATFRDAERSYSSVALYSRENFILGGDNPERIVGERVSAQYLTMLGVRVALGRDFPADEDAHPDAAKLAIISNALWQRRFNADPSAIGRVLQVDGVSFQIIGVLPPAFHGTSGKAELLVPVTARSAADLTAWSLEFSLLGRLKPGVTVGQAESETKLLAPLIYRATPMDKGTLSSGPGGTWGAEARPLNSIRVASGLRRSVLVLFGAVGLVLLIACVNLANLLLGRAMARRQEIAIRLAIGAGRARLVRLLLSESLMLATLGGIASVALAWWATHLLSTINSAETLQVQGLGGGVGLVGFDAIHLDLRALGFTFAITLVVGMLFGLVPALQATKAELVESLKEGSARGGAHIGASRRSLVVIELALALVLLVGSGLMIRSLGNLLAVNPGFDASHLLTLRLTIPPGTTATDSMPGFYEQLQARLSGLPGVQQVALADCPPLSGGCNGTLMTFPDRPASATGNAIVGVHWVSPSWFTTLQVPLKRGRMFNSDDRSGGPRVVLISEAAAEKYWPHGTDPIGQRVKVYQGGFDAGATVIGIVGDVRFGTIDSLPVPDAYISYAQSHVPYMMIFIRTTGDPDALIAVARHALHDLAPQDPLYDVATMTSRVGAARAEASFSATLLGLFAVVALALAVMGIYGVMSFGVAQRTREIGIRIALGAEPASVVGMIVRDGIRLAAVGGAIGLVAALALTRVMRSLLFEVTPTDVPTYAVIVALLSIAALVASWLPARQAARIDPTDALRRG